MTNNIAPQNTQSPLIMIIADGIYNSVFVSQVLDPLIKRAQGRPLVLVSFERPVPTQLPAELKNFPGSLIMLPRLHFVSTLCLMPAASQLRRILKKYPAYDLIARGPIAGWIALRALNARCTKLTIQARGLLAEEYKLTHAANKNPLQALKARFRTKQFLNLEQTVYGTRKANITIEAVSPALGEYLIKEFGADAAHITIAEIDKPQAIAQPQITTWRAEVRKELDIPSDARVWCYNGSAKAWQCPEETVRYLAKKLAEDQMHYALVLTPDTKVFEQLFKQLNIDKQRYRILMVPARETFRYLAAADVGVIFRAASPVNWISRPTKVLEYRAVGLTVIHNNTIAWLANPE